MINAIIVVLFNNHANAIDVKINENLVCFSNEQLFVAIKNAEQKGLSKNLQLLSEECENRKNPYYRVEELTYWIGKIRNDICQMKKEYEKNENQIMKKSLLAFGILNELDSLKYNILQSIIGESKSEKAGHEANAKITLTKIGFINKIIEEYQIQSDISKKNNKQFEFYMPYEMISAAIGIQKELMKTINEPRSEVKKETTQTDEKINSPSLRGRLKDIRLSISKIYAEISDQKEREKQISNLSKEATEIQDKLLQTGK